MKSNYGSTYHVGARKVRAIVQSPPVKVKLLFTQSKEKQRRRVSRKVFPLKQISSFNRDRYRLLGTTTITTIHGHILIGYWKVKWILLLASFRTMRCERDRVKEGRHRPHLIIKLPKNRAQADPPSSIIGITLRLKVPWKMLVVKPCWVFLFRRRMRNTFRLGSLLLSVTVIGNGGVLHVTFVFPPRMSYVMNISCPLKQQITRNGIISQVRRLNPLQIMARHRPARVILK